MGGLKRVRNGAMEIFKLATMHFVQPLIVYIHIYILYIICLTAHVDIK